MPALAGGWWWGSWWPVPRVAPRAGQQEEQRLQGHLDLWPLLFLLPVADK